MKTIDEMTLDEFANLTVLLNSIEQHIAISGKSNEELIEMASDYWAELKLDNPVATLIYELMERLENAERENKQLLSVCKLALEWHIKYPLDDLDIEADNDVELYEQLQTVIAAADENI